MTYEDALKQIKALGGSDLAAGSIIFGAIVELVIGGLMGEEKFSYVALCHLIHARDYCRDMQKLLC